MLPVSVAGILTPSPFSNILVVPLLAYTSPLRSPETLPVTVPVTLPVTLPVTVPVTLPVTLPVKFPLNPVVAVTVVPFTVVGVVAPIGVALILPPDIVASLKLLDPVLDTSPVTLPVKRALSPVEPLSSTLMPLVE